MVAPGTLLSEPTKHSQHPKGFLQITSKSEFIGPIWW
jgi:hypothetical protein